MSTVAAIVCIAAKAFSCQPAEIYVIDGDTFRIGREKVRVQGIDAPEMKGACRRESELARGAKERLASFIAGKQVEIDRNGQDIHRRTLAFVKADGKDVGQMLLAEGLARRWEKEWRPGLDEIWCK